MHNGLAFAAQAAPALQLRKTFDGDELVATVALSLLSRTATVDDLSRSLEDYFMGKSLDSACARATAGQRASCCRRACTARNY
jgi:hypothetical protein